MNEKAIRILEFDKIQQMLVHHAGSSLGRELAGALKPAEDLETVREWQTQTKDAYDRICEKGSLSFSGIPDVRDSFLRIERGGCLTIVELLRVSSLLTATLRAKNYGYRKDDRDEERIDSLTELFSLLTPLSPVNHEIQRCIVSEEEVADDASAGLRNVRRQIKSVNDKVRERLGSILSQAAAQGMLQDSLITMRDGRYCLPYKSEYKNQVAGMVHDQSASGSTSFIEPMEVVKLNNELRELALREQEEIEKVLAALTAELAPEVYNLRYNQNALAQLDFIFAKGMLARDMRAVCPEFSENRVIRIHQGRHPLIDAKKVVPIDLSFGEENTMVVITGPNTGGKTVTLKTAGLFVLMAQAGLHVPAKHGTEFGIFREVYADIGDEQSIEQSLSTFSSHMTNTVHILEEADEQSLVLFDELGAGTDPTEGAALAMAILSHLHRQDIRTMATTHYAELKVFAMTTQGVINACCEFDVESLKPTYRLLLGIPGKSNAFAISKKLGLSDDIIEEADSLIGVKDKSFEDLMADLENKRQIMERELADARAKQREANQYKSEWEKKAKQADERREQIVQKAKEEARNILQETKDFADDAIKKMRNLEKANGNERSMEEERRRVREKLSQNETRSALPKKVQEANHKPTDYHIGDTVHIISMNLNGTIHTLPNDKGDCFVTAGIMKMKVNIRNLAIIPDAAPEPAKAKVRTGTGGMGKAMQVSPEINLVGKRVDDAIAELDKYLDDAYLAHLPKVTVIHGRGTGALRTAVHSHCKKLKYVKELTLSPDYGSTEVVFRG